MRKTAALFNIRDRVRSSIRILVMLKQAIPNVFVKDFQAALTPAEK